MSSKILQHRIKKLGALREMFLFAKELHTQKILWPVSLYNSNAPSDDIINTRLMADVPHQLHDPKFSS